MTRTSGNAAADHSRDRDARVEKRSLLRGLDGNICMLTHRAHVGADALTGFSHRCRQHDISADARSRERTSDRLCASINPSMTSLRSLWSLLTAMFGFASHCGEGVNQRKREAEMRGTRTWTLWIVEMYLTALRYAVGFFSAITERPRSALLRPWLRLSIVSHRLFAVRQS